MPESDALARVRRARARRDAADREWREAITAAVGLHSLRAVGAAAGVSHVAVLKIVRGDGPGHPPDYYRAHRRVEQLRGKPRECQRCGTTDPTKTYEWANLTGDYESPDDYERMCRSCHRKYDRERRDRT